MRTLMRTVLTFVAAAIVGAFSSTVNAENNNCPISGNYTVGFDGCYHRLPWAVANGCAPRFNDCGHSRAAMSPSPQQARPAPEAAQTKDAIRQEWVAVQDVGSDRGFFNSLSQNVAPSKIAKGDILQANRNINVRQAPADWKSVSFVLKKYQVVKILDTRTLHVEDGSTQIWAQVNTLPPQDPTYRQVLSFIQFNNDSAARAKELIEATLQHEGILDNRYDSQRIDQIFVHSKDENIFRVIHQAYDHLKGDLLQAPEAPEQQAPEQQAPEQLDPNIDEDHVPTNEEMQQIKDDARLHGVDPNDPGRIAPPVDVDDQGGGGGQQQQAQPEQQQAQPEQQQAQPEQQQAQPEQQQAQPEQQQAQPEQQQAQPEQQQAQPEQQQAQPEQQQAQPDVDDNQGGNGGGVGDGGGGGGGGEDGGGEGGGAE